MRSDTTLQLITDLTGVLERLDRIEGWIAGLRKPELIRAKAAIALFGGTRPQFYRLVASGVIQQIRYEAQTDPLYDAEQIVEVINRHRIGSGVALVTSAPAQLPRRRPPRQQLPA